MTAEKLTRTRYTDPNSGGLPRSGDTARGESLVDADHDHFDSNWHAATTPRSE